MRKTVLTVAAATAIFAGCADAFSPMPLAMPRARATSSVSSLRMSEDASAVLARMNAMMNGGTYTPPAPAAYSPPPPAAYSPPPPAAYSPPPAAPAAYQPPAAPASPPAAAPPAAPAPSSKAFSWDPPDVTSAKINAVLNSPSVLNHPSRGQKEAFYQRLGLSQAESRRLVSRVIAFEEIKRINKDAMPQYEIA